MKQPIALFGALLAALIFVPGPAQAQFANGLVAYWPFNGDLLDSSDTEADGTFVPGSGDQELRFAPGQFGDGINLNDFAAGAFEQYVSIDSVAEDTFDFTGGSMTVSLWVSTPFLSIDNQTIVAKGTGSSWSLARGSATSTAAFHGGGSAATGDPVTDFIDDTLMHHLVGVAEAGVGVRLYLDGQLIGSANGNIQLGNSDEPLAIGANPADEANLFRTWEGLIDDVAIWDRALSAGEIATLYNGGTGVSVADVLNPVDTDEDGMPDFYENTNGLNPAVDDAGDDLDGDGLSNLQEYNKGTNPQAADTDDDGLNDGDEINVHDTDPVSSDSDTDGLNDGDEINGTLNPFLDGVLRDPFDPEVDPAGDATDPNSADSDSDDFGDQVEIEFQSNPNDPEDSPSPWQIGLKGYWPLDKASYDASGDDSFPDASGRGFPGKLAGESLSPLWFSSPFYPQVVRLNGTDQRIEIQGDPDEFAMSGSDLTVSAWFLTPGWGKNWQAVVAKGEGNNWRVHRQASAGNVAFAGGRADIGGGPSVADFQWHHVVAQSQNGVGTRLFVDGEQVAIGSGSDLSANGQPMMIGGNPDTAGDSFRTLFGAACEVAVWNRVLTDAEVDLLWLNGEGATVAALIAAVDTDMDGLSDIYENAFGLDPDDPNGDNGGEGDPDDDGLSNADEEKANTHPTIADTDEDGLNDGQEISLGTDPLNTDSDNDGLADSDEVNGTRNPFLDGNLRDPFDPETDPAGDPTDPLAADSDGDSWFDSNEILCLTNPNDAAEFCPFPVPVAYWPLDEILDNATPDEAGDHDLSLVNLSGADFTEGRFGQAFSFVASRRTMLTRVSSPGDALPICQHQNFTISLWVNATGTGQNDLRFFSEASTTTNSPLLNIGTNVSGSQGTIDIYIRNSGGSHGGHDNSVLAPLDGQGWRHLALVVEKGATKVTLYINGEEDQADFTFIDPYASVVNTTSIGGILRAAASHWVTGGIDDVALWNQALSAGEIKQIADGTINPLGESLVETNDPDVRITAADFEGAAFQVSVEGLDGAESYILRRSLDGENFTEVGDPFTGANANVFVDPAPPAGRALYQIWTAP